MTRDNTLNITYIIRHNDTSALERYFKRHTITELSITDSNIVDAVKYNRIKIINILLANSYVIPINDERAMYFMWLDICYNSKYEIAEILIRNRIVNYNACIQFDYYRINLTEYLLTGGYCDFYQLLVKYDQMNIPYSLFNRLDELPIKSILLLHKDNKFNRKSCNLSIVFDTIHKTSNQQVKKLHSTIKFNFEFIRILDILFKRCSLWNLSEMRISYIIRKLIYGF